MITAAALGKGPRCSVVGVVGKVGALLRSCMQLILCSVSRTSRRHGASDDWDRIPGGCQTPKSVPIAAARAGVNVRREMPGSDGPGCFVAVPCSMQAKQAVSSVIGWWGPADSAASDPSSRRRGDGPVGGIHITVTTDCAVTTTCAFVRRPHGSQTGRRRLFWRRNPLWIFGDTCDRARH